MSFSKFLLLPALVLLTCASAHAETPGETPISNDIVAPLAAWVGKAMDAKIDGLPLTVASDTKLQSALRLEEDVQRAGAAAAYLPGRIVISNEVWDPASLQAQSYIVHELVHHVQLVSGHSYACHAAKEREAYTLQNQWLAEHGQQPIVTQNWIEKMSSCDASDGAKASD